MKKRWQVEYELAQVVSNFHRDRVLALALGFAMGLVTGLLINVGAA